MELLNGCFPATKEKISPREFIDEMKNKGELILGIGHKIRTSLNPDKRVLLLRKFAKQNLKATRYLNYALAVEQETLKKKNNLILNVDGATAAIFLDILKSSRFTQTEIEEIVDAGMLNGLFALSRSIGIIGHALDQKRLKQGLYRHAWDDILYM
ncbi:MAG: citrate synthase [candidate division WS6 bacterium OLB21]|uniref:citrate synthase (unknown stereospecificity) n=1 Tax=candidate division WS6 bacterium OLB21 TaxID=1617427 RepID=A0A136KG30_9BACT|nr:MAG: citrate synthase [candidate division WS6 bacterium OLB21]